MTIDNVIYGMTNGSGCGYSSLCVLIVYFISFHLFLFLILFVLPFCVYINALTLK